MRRLALFLPVLGFLTGCTAPAGSRMQSERHGAPLFARLSNSSDGDFENMRAAFGRNNPGYDIEYLPAFRAVPAANHARIIFVQSGQATGRTGTDSSALAVGDAVVLRKGAALSLDGEIAALSFRVPVEPPSDVPTFIRPDWDAKITDTPGGCATETGAYRRILLTWLGKNGPYLCHALNAHRVRIMNSFTHYHPVDGGFDEFYLVQMAGPDARLLTSLRLEKILHPESVDAADVSGLIESHPLHVGDLVYLPRGVVHRGVGGALVQVITIPGFKPGAEIGVDHHLSAVNRRLNLTGIDALPLNAEAADKEDAQRGGVQISAQKSAGGADRGQMLAITINSKPFTEYHPTDSSRPYFYPVLGPGGVNVTRHFPMRTDHPEEETDHTHQRSLWFAHGDVNGVDFWTEGPKCGVIRHTGYGDIVSGPVFGSFACRNDWTTADGQVICTDERVFRVYALPEPHSDERMFDYEITLIASQGPLKFGDTKEGMMAMRLAPWLCLSGKTPLGHVINSAGDRGASAWGKRADWVDYWGTFKDKDGERVLGVAIFDHPSNPRHPTWWHARDYGLFAANPFGQHDFENKPAGAGDYELKAGERITFRYRFYIHEGDCDKAGIAELFGGFGHDPP